jgi:hypothetical protein
MREKFPVKPSRNHCLLRYGLCSFHFYSRCSMWFPCISKQLSAIRHIEVFSLSKISVSPNFPDRSSLCYKTSKSLIGAEHTKDFRCPHSQKSRVLRSGDRAGQLTGPPLPIHCSPKAWFMCCMKMHRK